MRGVVVAVRVELQAVEASWVPAAPRRQCVWEGVGQRVLDVLLTLNTVCHGLLTYPHLSPHAVWELAPGTLATAGALGADTATVAAGRFAVVQAGTEGRGQSLRGRGCWVHVAALHAECGVLGVLVVVAMMVRMRGLWSVLVLPLGLGVGLV